MNNSIDLSLIQTGKFTVEQMLKVGYKADNWRVWQAIVQHIDFGKLTVEQMLEVGNKANDNESDWRQGPSTHPVALFC